MVKFSLWSHSLNLYFIFFRTFSFRTNILFPIEFDQMIVLLVYTVTHESVVVFIQQFYIFNIFQPRGVVVEQIQLSICYSKKTFVFIINLIVQNKVCVRKF